MASSKYLRSRLARMRLASDHVTGSLLIRPCRRRATRATFFSATVSSTMVWRSASARARDSAPLRSSA